MENHKLYGYEGYTTHHIYGNMFRENYTYSCSIYTDQGNCTMIPLEGMNYKKLTHVEEHPELIKTAKKVFVHSNCDIPRDLIRRKYKIVRNPYMADMVVFPDLPRETSPESKQMLVSNDQYVIVFVDDVRKAIYHCRLYDYYTPEESLINKFKSIPKGRSLYNCVPASSKSGITEFPHIYDAKYTYLGKMAYFYPKDKYLLDYFLGEVPANKIVFQKHVLKELGGEDNKPTLEIMLSVNEMLKSNDSENVALGMKTLAALDYPHYKQSFRFLLSNSSRWEWNGARSSSAVKVMLKTLDMTRTARWRTRWRRDETIEKCDYELYEPLVTALNEFDNTKYVQYCLRMHTNFLYVDNEFVVHPRILKEKDDKQEDN